MKTQHLFLGMLFFLLLCSSVHAQTKCISPNIIQLDSGIAVIDNYDSGLYRTFHIHNGDTTMFIEEYPKVPEKIFPGDRFWVHKFCTDYKITVDGIERINFYNAHQDHRYWVTSNTITIK